MTERAANFELLQGAPIAALLLDHAGVIVAMNAAAADLLGVAAADAIGRPIAATLPVRGEADAWRSLLTDNSDRPRVWTTEPARGPSATCEWTARPLPDGGAVCYVRPAAPTVDAAQQRVRDLLLRALLDNLEIAAWVTDMNGVALLLDGVGVARSGLTPETVIGRNLVAMFGARYPSIPEGLHGRSGRFASQEGEGHFDNWTIPVRDEHGRQIALAGITLDVTESRRREDELQRKLDIIERQQRALREMSTPIIEVWDQVLCLPIVGLVDTSRAADVMDNLLQAVTRTRARFAILDLTGVDVVDTSTASHLLSLIRALRLLGAEGVLTGVHPNIAQTIVTLGVDLSGLLVRATLRDALKHVLAVMSRR